MTTPYQAALQTLRRVHDGLGSTPSPAERTRLLELHDQALRLLEASGRRRVETTALAARVAELERSLASMPPAERVATIRERLGISRAYYFRLRKRANPAPGVKR